MLPFIHSARSINYSSFSDSIRFHPIHFENSKGENVGERVRLEFGRDRTTGGFRIRRIWPMRGGGLEDSEDLCDDPRYRATILRFQSFLRGYRISRDGLDRTAVILRRITEQVEACVGEALYRAYKSCILVHSSVRIIRGITVTTGVLSGN